MKMLTTKGTVTNIEDPAKAGRIKVQLAELGGNEIPNFIDPVSKPGWLWLPEVGDVVQVIIPENLEDLVEFPDDIRWTGQILDQENPVPKELQKNYPKRRGFKTLAGHLLIIDDTQGEEEITLSHKGVLLFSQTNNGIFFGTQSADEPFVLGKQFQTLLSTVLGSVSGLAFDLSTHSHVSAPGLPLPTDITKFLATKTVIDLEKTKVDNGDQLSEFIYGQKKKPS